MDNNVRGKIIAEFLVCGAEYPDGATAIVKFNDIAPILKNLLDSGKVKIGLIDCSDVDYDGYDDEYLITVCYVVDEETPEMSVEKAWNEKDKFYYGYGADIVIASEDTDPKVILANELEEYKVIYID